MASGTSTSLSDTLADSVAAAFLDPEASCTGLGDSRSGCESVGRATLYPASHERPQQVDAAVSLPADLVDPPTELGFVVVAYGQSGTEGRLAS